MSLLSVRPLLFICACVAATQCAASPSVPAAPIQAPDAAELAPLPSTSRRSAADSDSQSMELLVEMQQRNAGISFNERVRTGDARDVRMRPVATPALPEQPSAAGAPTAAVPTPPSGLFGSGATPMVTEQRSATALSRPAAPTGSTYGDGNRSSAFGSSGRGAEPPRWLLVPRDVIEYVRDNRATVVGSVVALFGLMWVGSLMFARSRH